MKVDFNKKITLFLLLGRQCSDATVSIEDRKQNGPKLTGKKSPHNVESTLNNPVIPAKLLQINYVIVGVGL